MATTSTFRPRSVYGAPNILFTQPGEMAPVDEWNLNEDGTWSPPGETAPLDMLNFSIPGYDFGDLLDGWDSEYGLGEGDEESEEEEIGLDEDELGLGGVAGDVDTYLDEGATPTFGGAYIGPGIAPPEQENPNWFSEGWAKLFGGAGDWLGGLFGRGQEAPPERDQFATTTAVEDSWMLNYPAEEAGPQANAPYGVLTPEQVSILKEIGVRDSIIRYAGVTSKDGASAMDNAQTLEAEQRKADQAKASAEILDAYRKAQTLKALQPAGSSGEPRVSYSYSTSDYGPNRMALEQGKLGIEQGKLDAQMAGVYAKLQELENQRTHWENELKQQAAIAQAKIEQAYRLGADRNAIAMAQLQVQQALAEKKAAQDRYIADQKADIARQANLIKLEIARMQAMSKWNVPGAGAVRGPGAPRSVYGWSYQGSNW